jgi:predicted GTPase
MNGPDSTDSAVAPKRPRSQAGERILSALDELSSLTEGLLPVTGHQNLVAARVRVAEDRFNLVVLGEFKRGKSTLVNALLDRDVLPTGVIPLTSVVTVIRSAPVERLVIRFTDGREEEHDLADLDRYVTEARNPRNRLGVELALVELNHELLRAGLELIDTPGIGSIHSHNTEIARGFLPRVDAALCVLDAGQPLSEGERELLVEAADRVPRLLMVVNKLDHLEARDRDVSGDFIRSALRHLLGAREPEVFPLSARERAGIEPLVERLGRLAGEEREALLLRSIARLARGIAADGAQAARFEAHAIELPLDELLSRTQLFEQRIVELQAASAEAADLLERGVQSALKERVNQPLSEHARSEAPRLAQLLRARLESLGRRAPRDLATELELWIDQTVREDFEQLVPQFESAIADELTALESRYAARIQNILEQVQDVAQDVFGARASDVLPDTGLRAPSRFTFKLKDVEHALDIIVGFGRTITPGALGRRLVIRDAEQRLIEMTDRHAGRLRSELVTRVSAAAQEYQRELRAAVDEAVGSIRYAIERASEDRRRGEEHARQRLDELERVRQRCQELTAQFEGWS